MDQTRRRITAAAVELHEAVGPLATTIAAIAERAGVGRPTVYAHFPDEPALFAACTAHHFGLHPPPDIGAWTAEPDPVTRLARGLSELYAYWEEIEPMATSVLRDHLAAPERVGQGFALFMEGCADLLASGWPARGRAKRLVRAAVGHAVRFETWRSLTRQQGAPSWRGRRADGGDRRRRSADRASQRLVSWSRAAVLAPPAVARPMN